MARTVVAFPERSADGANVVEIKGSNIRDAESVTPADGSDLGKVASGDYSAAEMIYVGASGDVVATVDGTDITFTALAAGVWHPMPPYTRVKSTGTTATGVVAGY